MNERAVQAADDRFYREHPDRVDPVTGERRPLTLGPEDAALRREWMAMYQEASADPAFSAAPAREAVTECPSETPPPPDPPPPTCKVEVGATHLGWMGSDYYHLFVLYTNEGGSVYYYRGGPSAGGFSAPSQASGGSSDGSSQDGSGSGSNPSAGPSESSGSSGSSSPSGGSSASATPGSSEEGGGSFGYIHVMHGEYVAGTIDWDPGARRVTVAEGPEVCGANAKLEAALAAVAASHTPYRPLGPNSNTTVYTILRNSGFTPQVPAGVWAPGKDEVINTAGSE